MKRINISLTKQGSITKAIEQLEQYKKDLATKTELFVSRLLHEGKITAEANCGAYGQYITFREELDANEYGCTGLLIATDREKIISQWYRGGKLVSAEVSPLLMSEFGSGWLAKVYFPSVEGEVGQGTFPGQRHAFDPNGWSWTDENGVRHHSIGEQPTHPMYSALMTMIFEVNRIAREVFGNG